MPALSAARIAANRRNAARSTGPKTPEGKAISRRNGLKHGLTGQGIVLPEVDIPEVDRRAEALLDELAPQSTLGAILVGQLATLSVRMERAASREEAALTRRIRHAGETFDRERFDEAEVIYDCLAEDPRTCLMELKRFPEGVDRLIEGWESLRENLTRSPIPYYWDESHHTTLAHLLGKRPEQIRGTRVDDLSVAVQGGVSMKDPECAELDLKSRRGFARDRLVERITEETDRLKQHRETLDLEMIELDRREAADLALFDPSPDGVLTRRYETEARRGFFRTLKEFRQVEADFDAEIEVDEPAAAEVNPEQDRASVGSSCAGRSTTPREPLPLPEVTSAMLPPPLNNLPRGVNGRVPVANWVAVAPG